MRRNTLLTSMGGFKKNKEIADSSPKIFLLCLSAMYLDTPSLLQNVASSGSSTAAIQQAIIDEFCNMRIAENPHPKPPQAQEIVEDVDPEAAAKAEEAAQNEANWAVTVLKEDFEIHNADEWKEKLQWLKKEGHRTAFQEIDTMVTQQFPSAKSAADIQAPPVSEGEEGESESTPSLPPNLDNYFAAKAKLRTKNLAGYDVAQYIWILRLGYNAGYVEIEDAWDLGQQILYMAIQEMQSHRDFCSGYFAGYIFDTGSTEMTVHHNACATLLTSPVSPWGVYGWLG